ncbi:YebC/PmpR family DNA-binding transcriptional regulator [Carnimonas nigrificans]|uniref:YebC/PmpR family DNA-binding transcriptional regulator n=1 Tax=Carnimonas nigrificans TaxID=64323 RepID=UPI00046E9074|nr:YebC/PmpR family DNA-binding transcriptional regulator [Carnimonas nigrificans]
MGRTFENRKASMAKTAAAKTKVYSKYGRELYVCAKHGGPDPSANLALRSMIDRAKKDQVPSHVIDKALEKANGVGGEDYSPARYEGFGPANSMLIIECLTDNPNRTFGDVRGSFTKSKCKIGTQGTVSHMFNHNAIFSFKADAERNEESVLEALMMADVDVTDIEQDDDQINVFVPPTEYGKTTQALTDQFGTIDFDTAEIQFLPQSTMTLEGDELAQFEKLCDLLNDLDDVQNIYHNVEL